MSGKLCLLADNSDGGVYISLLCRVGLAWICLAVAVQSSVTEEPNPGEYIIYTGQRSPDYGGDDTGIETSVHSFIHSYF